MISSNQTKNMAKNILVGITNWLLWVITEGERSPYQHTTNLTLCSLNEMLEPSSN